MALLNCKECGREVSTQAKRCPNCGARAPKKPVPSWLVIVAVTFWSLIVYACKHIPEQDLTPAEKVDKTIRHAAFACAASIKDYLNDPDSADFDFDHVNATPKISGNQAFWVVSLPVRAKNAFNATVQNVFQCHVQVGEDNNWKTLSIRRID